MSFPEHTNTILNYDAIRALDKAHMRLIKVSREFPLINVAFSDGLTDDDPFVAASCQGRLLFVRKQKSVEFPERR